MTEPRIVSCGMCSQPFAVEAERLAGKVALAVPDHPMLGPMGEPGRGSCRGSSLPPLMHPSRSRWEAWWRRHYGDAPGPPVLDGADVRLS